MITKKTLIMKKIIIAATIFSFLMAGTLSGCKEIWKNDDYYNSSSTSSDGTSKTDYESTVETSTTTVNEEESDYNFNTSTTNKIIGNTTSVAVEGTGATASGSVATITASGDYIVTGDLSDGKIIVDVEEGDEGTVKIILENANFSCSSGSALQIKTAEKVSVLISDDTENTFSSTYTGTDSVAAIHSKQDLFISAGENATGKLNITASNYAAIKSTDGLIINGGIINATAGGNAIQAKDYIIIRDGEITANAQKHGIKTTSDKTDKGYVYISGGNFNITSSKDGIHSSGITQIDNGTFTISASDDGIASESHVTINNGTFTTITATDKGINASGNITIKNGTYTIVKPDKCIAANGDITIDGGTFTLSPTYTQSGESGNGHGITTKKNDSTNLRTGNVTINDGNINITGSYEGIQGVVITVNGGTIKVYSTDDAFNASDGSSQMGGGGFGPGNWGNTTTSSSTASIALIINGGNIYVKAQGDGLDSNGSMTINGGIVLVSQYGSGNEPLDAGDNYTPQIVGGVVIAAGYIFQPVEAPNCSQTAFQVSCNGNANSYFAVNDNNGNNVLAWKIPQSYEIITVSSPNFTSGTYNYITSATISGTEYIEDFDFYYPANSCTGANTSITLTNGSCYSSVSSNGNNQGGGNIPGGNQGGFGGPKGSGLSW